MFISINHIFHCIALIGTWDLFCPFLFHWAKKFGSPEFQVDVGALKFRYHMHSSRYIYIFV